MQLRDRTIVHQPPGLEPTLARAATDAGAWAMIDATRPGWHDQIAGLPSDQLVLRVDPTTEPTDQPALAMLTTQRLAHRDVAALQDTIQAWQAIGVPVAVEVRSKAEGRRARDAGGDLLVARGAEGPGRASTRSNLVLLPALATLDLPIIAWGGAGPNATGALLVHAEMVVLDAQLYLLPETGLSQAWHRALGAFDGSDVKAIGQTLDEPFYLHARVAHQAVHDLWETEQAATDQGPATRRKRLTEALDEHLAGFDVPPGEGFHPLGHDAAHATALAQHGSLEAVLDALEARVTDQLSSFPLQEGSPLAQSHGTRLPVVQGAMANVSEVPPFAKAVSDAGGLPFLAFAALREHWAEEALIGTKKALDGASFGCGIIGLDVNAKKRDAHIRILKEHTPPIALIAAGTAEQALDLENAGISTYLHTPSQGIVQQALDMGLDHIVVEGNECGGHIGKLPSLVLWDQALQAAQGHPGLHVLLAGGVSDDATAAMAGTLAAGLDDLKVGVLMGTAYLATREIVETGAITEAYQRLVLASNRTEVTGETVGIRARSAPTPFTEKITGLERELVRQGQPLDDRKQTLEHENLGATRTAARGVKRAKDGTYHDVPTEEQLADGNYLMGQGAELLEEVYSIKELHTRVTSRAHTVQQAAADRLARGLDLPTRQPIHQPPHEATDQPTDELADRATHGDRTIAIVGLGCVLPDAPDVATFWDNLQDGHVSIQELPEGRWPVPASAHLRDGGQDGTYTVLGGFIDPDQSPFDPIAYRIPPAVADQMDASQRWAIQATDQAIQDADLAEIEARDRWAVILGNALGGEQRAWTERRLSLRETAAQIEQEDDLDPDEKQAALGVIERQLDKLPPITEDTMPGELSNVIAGRVCSVFDIGGPARTVDAACASSLAATEQAVGLLRDGAVDVAITGGVDRSMDPAAYAKFSAIGALSRDGSFPFDQKASGFVMGEGCGILVLKRLADAVADGDRIYATIQGVGSSSDGKGKGITAPNPSGQVRAIRSALDDAGWDPTTLSLIEAHGTGTPVGDPAEAQTLEAILDGADPRSVALGSVKGNIGHLKAAAGAAGLIKATLAIHHATLPPTVVGQPTDQVDWETSPLTLVTEPAPWDDLHRRAGVSAFGFGGTNSHVLLSAPDVPTTDPQRPDPTPQTTSQPAAQASPAGRTLGLKRVSGQDREAVLAQLDDDPGTWTFETDDPVRLAVTAEADLATAKTVLAGDLPAELALSKGIALAEGSPGELGIVFPGQGSQYPGMVLDLADTYQAAREVLDEADQVLTPLIGQPLSDILALEGKQGLAALTPTEVCQPAVLTCDIAILAILEELGVQPDVVAGHSLGEYAALVAAEVISFEDALHAVSARGREMADVEVDDPGGLIAVRADRQQAQALIERLEAWPANVNGPEQTVLAATTEALDTIEARAEDAGIQASRLPVSAAFHSPIVAPATEPLGRVLGNIAVDPPRIPVISNVTAEPYPEEPDKIRELLARQVAAPVEWVATMAAFEDHGVDLIVEAGPKRVLSNLAMANLPGTPAVPTANPRTGAKQTFGQALLVLAAHGHLDVDADPDDQPTTAPSTSQGPSRTRSRAGTPPSARPQTPDGQARARVRTPAQTPTAGTSRTVPKVVVSGVSVGLPGAKDPFAPGEVEALLDGTNRIEPVPGHLKQAMADMGITRLVKDEDQGPHLSAIDDPDQVVQLAARLGSVDLAEYDVQEDWVEHTDATAELALVAALNALTDAKIPLVRETRETSTGTILEDGWVLPEPLQDETGVILASAFPGYDSLVSNLQQRAHQAVQQGASPEVLVDAINRLSEHIDTPEGQQALMDWASQTHLGQPAGTDGPEPAAAQDQPGFPRGFLFQALAMGHAQVAQLLRARGPNLQVNAACASTTAALSLARDWITTGRCKRVIVVGADVAGNEALLPLVGAGFLSAGAATTSDKVEEAALPFDQRRNGMLIGSGALGIVLETEEAASQRGLTPLAELVDAHLANSAFHGARLHPGHVAQEVTTFLDRARATLELGQDELAQDLVFVSHEPATPARGGSAQAEVDALRSALGEAAGDVLISNTKGLTGHAMGAGIEDAMAVELLRHRRAPPVANLQQPDPGFKDLSFSTGDPTDRSLSLRFAAGFGSQVAMALFHRTTDTPGALDKASFDAWIDQAIGQGLTVETRHRLLRAVRPGSQAAGKAPKQQAAVAQTAGSTNGGPAPTATPPTPSQAQGKDQTTEAQQTVQALAGPDRQATPAIDQAAVVELLTELVSQRTGYPIDVIEPGMDLEADLGVDTVKQAEVLAQARKELEIPPIEGMSLSDVPTLEQAAALLAEHAGVPADEETGEAAQTRVDDGQPGRTSAAPADEPVPAEATQAPGQGSVAATDTEAVIDLLTDLVSQRTGYPVDVIEPGMDLEADLGVDTVKQAEVLAQARKELDIPPIEGMSLSDVPTLEQAAALLAKHAPASKTASQPEAEGPGQAADPAQTGDEANQQEDAQPTIQIHQLADSPAPVGNRLPDGTTVHVDERLSDGLLRQLETAGARTLTDQEGQVADLTVIPIAPAEDEATMIDDLVDLLTDLQALPAETRVVLLAPADHPAATGIGPLCATLSAEDRPARAILVDPGTPSQRVADEILTDLTTTVRLGPETRRATTTAPGPSPQPEALAPEPGTVVLAPGGLGAAVHPCLAALASKHDVRLVVLGRSPAQDPGLDPDDEEAVAKLRDRLFQEAKQAGKVTPAEVEAQVQATVKQARRAQALAELETHAEVRYERVDATDPQALADLVDEITGTWGTPGLVIHGTGIDRSRAFTGKTAEEMALVLAAKLTPVLEITQALPEAHHVAFGSVAGVHGNPGQADYALANGCLTQLMARVDGTVIHWTAWDAAGGMADDDSVRAMLEAREVTYLDVEEGTGLFLKHAGQTGALVASDRPPEGPQAPTPAAGSSAATVTLTGHEAFLLDHQVGDRPLFPGVRHLQAMAEAARNQAPGQPVNGLSNIRFEKPLYVTERTTVEVPIGGPQAATRRDGRVHAEARLDPGQGTKPVAEVTDDELAEAQAWDRETIYDLLFHGPSFQPLLQARTAGDRATAQADLACGGAAPWAMALEAAMQTAGLAEGETGRMLLPVGIESVEIGPDPTHGQATVTVRRVGHDPVGSTWDATVEVDGQTVLAARAIRLQAVGALPRILDGLAELDLPETTRLATRPVGPFEPRDPRAKKAAEHEAGQAAAKDALQQAHGGQAVELERTEDGQPVPVEAPGSVSITHGHGLALATADPGHQVGVDLERIEARDAAWLEQTFTPAELEEIGASCLDQATGATVGWTLKEAAAKAIGTGLTVPFEELEIVEIGDGTATVQTPEGPVELCWNQLEGLAVAVGWRSA